MRSSLYRHVALAFVLSAPAAAIAQTVAVSEPTVAVTSEQIYIANTTDQEIVFFVESENTQRTEYRLAPGASGTLRGEQGDKWLNIEMQPGNGPAKTSSATAQ
ncbi:MAG TPA: hypothetical protein VL522_14355 [Bordetella sp.]|jgi:hypothetical protein|nr:hypothetical protein [Bordetella sp.]